MFGHNKSGLPSTITMYMPYANVSQYYFTTVKLTQEIKVTSFFFFFFQPMF